MKEILEPLKEYQRYQKEFDQKVEDTFKELLQKSGVDIEKNRETVKNYNHVDKTLKANMKKLSAIKGLKSFLIFLSVAGGISMLIGAFLTYGAVKNTTSMLSGILPLVIGAVVMIASILIITLVLRKKIKSYKMVVGELRENAQSFLDEAWEQMSPLNRLFDAKITYNLINSLGTIVQLDDYYSVLHEVYLHNCCQLPYFSSNDNSTINMVVGTIADNPFVISRELATEMRTKVYKGSMVVSWTETRRDSKGKSYTTTHTQTLIATLEKPCPFYDTETFLVYGNEAAPELNFSRKPQAHNKSDKQIERMVKRGEKKLERIAEDDFKHGDGSFVAMSDTEFDILFGAFDRDNENQFRLLFTPLAQRNTIEFIKDSPFDDDFYFIKQGKLNTIYAYHADGWNMLCGKQLTSYSVDYAKEMFTTSNHAFFKNIYFMLAPLLNIPIYQQRKPEDMDIDLSAETNIAAREAEMVANMLPQGLVMHDSTATNVICKVKYDSSIGHVDDIKIFAYSYGINKRLDYVPTIAGNGRTYAVPVEWDEYFPLTNVTSALAFDTNGLSAEKHSELLGLLSENESSCEIESLGIKAVAEHGGIMMVIPKQGEGLLLAEKINEILKTKNAD